MNFADLRVFDHEGLVGIGFGVGLVHELRCRHLAPPVVRLWVSSVSGLGRTGGWRALETELAEHLVGVLTESGWPPPIGDRARFQPHRVRDLRDLVAGPPVAYIRHRRQPE